MGIGVVGSFLGEVHSIMTDVRGNFELIDFIRQADFMQKSLGSFSVKVEMTFSAVKTPIAHTRLFAWAGLVSSGYNLKKAYSNPKPDKVAQSLGVALNIRTACSATASFMNGLKAVNVIECISSEAAQTAFKVATVACTPIAIVASMLSAAVFGGPAYNYYKVKRFSGEWEKQKGDNRALIEMINKMPPDEFEKIFRCEKSAIQLNLVQLSKPLSKGHRKTKTGKETIELRKALIAQLERRMQRTKKLMVLNMTNAALYATGCWLNIFKIAPMAAVVLKNVSAGWQLTSGAHQIYSTHVFTKQIGNIKKN